MKTATSTAVRAQFASYLNLREPTVVTQNGHYKAVLVPVETEGDVERLLMADNKQLMEILAESDRQIDATGGIPHDEFWKRVDAKYEKKSNGIRAKKTRKSTVVEKR